MRWTDERIAKLEKLWNDGLSAAQVAKELGWVSRSAVLGKAHRLGLDGRANPAVPRKPTSARKPSRPPTVSAPKEPAAFEVREKVTARPEPSGPVVLVDLDLMHCRWPIGPEKGVTTHFCGKNRIERNGILKPYCEAHCNRAYVGRAPKPLGSTFNYRQPTRRSA